jgi:hypothetical protein
MTTQAGILLPSSILQSGWFHALAVFVGINTLFYAGLALAKMFPKRRE